MTQLGFAGRVAIVTGAGGGLGRAHALELARRGATVVANDLGGSLDGSGSSTTAAGRVVEEIEALGGHAVANHDSVATAAGGQAIVDAAIDAFGRIDILVNNAGILRDKAFHNMDAQTFDSVIDVHLKGAFYVSQPAFTLMRAQGYGRIVNTTSASGLYGNFGQANYGAAKAGLLGLTRVLALEGEGHGIKVNAIAPIASTRMTADVLGDLSDTVSPEAVSPVVAYLAHEDCAVNGHIYSVAGGRVARIFVAETVGVVLSDLTPESVRDHLAQIQDGDGYLVIESLGEATSIIGAALEADVLDAESV
jgi:NAD(P)-dependent dehydrogenase (short-subunit alcohol dehydrogenase family)